LLREGNLERRNFYTQQSNKKGRHILVALSSLRRELVLRAVSFYTKKGINYLKTLSFKERLL